jgi:predicted N-acyltransferase
VNRIAAVNEAEWDACAGTDNPFIRHRFLRCVEDSGCVGGRSGWTPHHVVLEDAGGRLLAAAPAYRKDHSYGEYVFDHGWAEAYERAGGRYYPKLLVAVPFTPVPGPRLLVRPGVDAAHAQRALVDTLVAETERLGFSSLHVNFCTEGELALLTRRGLAARTGEQFHWTNRGYDSFDAYLGDLASRKRKAVRRERVEALAGGTIAIETFTGAAITPALWDAFFAFYMDTGGRKWGRPYLNRKFFQLLGERMADAVVLVIAFRGGAPIAGALNLQGGDCLYGRYWGCSETQRSLHFEVCYYQAIAYAIAHKLARVEAGAQGPHKLARGYLPARTHSAHWIADPTFRSAVKNYLIQERAQVEAEIAEVAEHSPFRHAPKATGEDD